MDIQYNRGQCTRLYGFMEKNNLRVALALETLQYGENGKI
jgi:hypothetical protein